MLDVASGSRAMLGLRWAQHGPAEAHQGSCERWEIMRHGHSSAPASDCGDALICTSPIGDPGGCIPSKKVNRTVGPGSMCGKSAFSERMGSVGTGFSQGKCWRASGPAVSRVHTRHLSKFSKMRFREKPPSSRLYFLVLAREFRRQSSALKSG